MARIIKYRDIPLDDLVIGKGQVRTEDPGRDVDELAQSIEAQGLLQPIVVCQAEDPGSWEILTGQRRFLAHKLLRRKTIAAAILDDRVDAETAKAISITENLVRRGLSGKELTDGITFLYNRYGTIKTVVEVTGLSRERVRRHVKYPRLRAELKKMVDAREIDINVALKAQDAATQDDGAVVVEEAIKLAREMATMSGVQQKRFVEVVNKDPGSSFEDAVEKAKTGAKVTQIVVTVTERTKTALRQFATEEGTNQDDAAVALIEDSLIRRGLLES